MNYIQYSMTFQQSCNLYTPAADSFVCKLGCLLHASLPAGVTCTQHSNTGVKTRIGQVRSSQPYPQCCRWLSISTSYAQHPYKTCDWLTWGNQPIPGCYLQYILVAADTPNWCEYVATVKCACFKSCFVPAWHVQCILQLCCGL
jgi:hypothetical protein